MPDLKVSIQFPITIREAHGTKYGTFVDSNLAGIEYGSEGQIKNKLKAKAEAQIAEAILDQKMASKGRVLGCADGSIYIISFQGGQWQTMHCGPGLTGGCYSIGGKDLESLVESTKKHAADVWGGVVWETSI